MSTAAHLGVSGASVRDVAEIIADEGDTTAHHQGTTARGDFWTTGTADWHASVVAYAPDMQLPGDADVIVDLYYPGESLHPLHQLTDRLYRRIVSSTTWDVSAESEVEGFPPRSRTRAAA